MMILQGLGPPRTVKCNTGDSAGAGAGDDRNDDNDDEDDDNDDNNNRTI